MTGNYKQEKRFEMTSSKWPQMETKEPAMTPSIAIGNFNANWTMENIRTV